MEERAENAISKINGWQCFQVLSPLDMGSAVVLIFFVPGICGSCGISKDLLFDHRII